MRMPRGSGRRRHSNRRRRRAGHRGGAFYGSASAGFPPGFHGAQAFGRAGVACIGEEADADEKGGGDAEAAIDERGEIHAARSAARRSKLRVRRSMMAAHMRAQTRVMK